ncbi:DotU family type IV/VI secretion system protein [Escherichia coli]|nr:DotU family type IV/VI secretion system protein [Escherichia coli]
MVNLLEFYMPVFVIITSLRAEPEKYYDYSVTREFILTRIRQAARDAERSELSKIECDAAFYAIVVMLDEVILCSELSFKKKWRDNLLQSEYFGHSIGGVEFFNKLNDIIESKSEAGFIYLVCLILGFKGKYSVSSRDDINEYISKLRFQYKLDEIDVLPMCDKDRNKNKLIHNPFIYAIFCVIVYSTLSFFLYIK